MKNLNKGVTTNKSNKEMNNQSEIMNEMMKAIDDWQREERETRIAIAHDPNKYENIVCPICGKEMSDTDSCNGDPLVNTCVCSECDKRYVFPFRLLTLGLNKKDTKEMADSYYHLYLNAELSIEFSNKVKLLFGNNSDVA